MPLAPVAEAPTLPPGAFIAPRLAALQEQVVVLDEQMATLTQTVREVQASIEQSTAASDVLRAARERRAKSCGTFGARVAKRRKALGISQRVLGERLHLSQGVISKMERDRMPLEAWHLPAIAHALGTTVPWLTGAGEPDAVDHGTDGAALR